MLNAVGILVAFLMLAAALSWILVWGRGKWWIRGILGAGTGWAGLVMWASIGQVAGWPVDGDPPKAGIDLGGVMIREPSDDLRYPGAIYLWGVPLSKEPRTAWWLVTLGRVDKKEPRCWRLPYSRSAHERAEGARRALAAGRRVVARPGGAPGQGEEVEGAGFGSQSEGSQEGSPGKNGRGAGMSPKRDDVHFYDLPQGTWPRKRPRGES
jgi:hypothetical protein